MFFVHPLIIKIVNFFPKHIMKRLSIVILCLLILDILISINRINKKPEILDDLVHPEQIETNIKEEPNSISSSLLFPLVLLKN